MYGPPPGWDYRMASRGFNGEALPEGAVGWTPEGEPYYGYGKIPILGPIAEWGRRAWDRIRRPTEGPAEAQATSNLLGKALNVVRPLGEGKTEADAGKKPTVLQMGARAVGEAIRGAGEILSAPAYATEMGLTGASETLQAGGEGSKLPDIEAQLEKAIPDVEDRGFLSDAAKMFEQYVLTLNPVLQTYNALRFLTSPMSAGQKRDIAEDQFNAARIAYSAWTDPALRAEYIRRFNAGEDPYLLQLDLQRPGAELVGQLVLDPLNLVGGWISKPQKARALTKGALVPDVLKPFVKAVAEASDVAKADAVNDLMRARKAYVVERGTRLTNLATETGLFARTAGSKRYIVSEVTNDVLSFLFQANPNKEDAVDMLGALVKSVSDNEDEALEGFSRLLKDQDLANVTLSEDFTDTGLFIRKMLEDENGVVDATKFLDDLAKAKTYDDMVLLAARKVDNAIEKAFPTVKQMSGAAEKIAKLEAAGKTGAEIPAELRKWAVMGEELSDRTKALAAFDDLAQRKFYQPINQFFATVYMGYNPGYAFRNMIQNYVHMFIDTPGAIPKSIWANLSGHPRGAVGRAEEATQMWLNMNPKVLGQGISTTQTKGVIQGVKGRGPTATFSDWIEQGGGAAIYSKAVEDAMRKMLVPGRGLPALTGLVEAGLPPQAAAYLARLVVDNYGNTKAAGQIFRSALADGKIAAWRTMGWLDPKAAKFLEQYQGGGRSLMSVLDEKFAGATAEQAQAAIDDILKGFKTEADKAYRHGIPLVVSEDMSKEEGALVNALMDIRGIGSDEANSLIAGTKTADHLVLLAERGYLNVLREQGDDGVRLADQLVKQWNVASDASVAASRKARAVFDDWVKTEKAKPGGGELVKGSERAQTLWNDWADELFGIWKKQVDDIARQSEEFMAVKGQTLGVDVDTQLKFAREYLAQSDAWHNAEYVDGMFVSGGEKLVPEAGAGAARAARGTGKFPWQNVDEPTDVSRIQDESDELFELRRNRDIYVEQANRMRAEAERAKTDAQTLFGDRWLEVQKNVKGTGIKYSVAAKKRGGKAVPANPYKKFREGLFKEPLLGPEQNMAANPSYFVAKTYPELEKTLTAVKEGIAANNFDIPVFTDDAIEAGIKAWEKTAASQVNEARWMAKKVADAQRKFSLLSYPEKRGFDSVMGYLFPYQFWYSRTYKNWMKRIADNPVILADYAKFRSTLESIHAGAPDWWKYQINSNELLGLDAENPLFFNLEATLNPLNGMTGVDFMDGEKRGTWFETALDDLGKFGPTTWTPFSIATAVAAYMRGDEESAARWAGRLFPQTATVKAALGLLHHKVSDLPLQGEYDPFVHLFSGGLDPYERKRVGRALGMLVDEGLVDAATARDAARAQKGPAWDMALDRAVNERMPGQLVSFFGGVGLKMRSQTDMQIDQFWGDYSKLWNMEPNLSPEEFKQGMADLKTTYPFMDAVLISRKSSIARDRAYAYSVLGDIPPSMTDDYAGAVGLPADMVNKFYDEKGGIDQWAESDRSRFMAAMVDIGAIIDVPNEATRNDWLQAKNQYASMSAEGQRIFGDDIWDRVDLYYGAKGDTPQAQQNADNILMADPQIQQALDYKAMMVSNDPILFPYYASLTQIERYWKSLMYDEIEAQTGMDIAQVWESQEQYYRALPGAERKAYKAEHPELAIYEDAKKKWTPIIDEKVAEFGSKLRDIPVGIRENVQAQSMGQEGLLDFLENQGRALPQMEWQEWQGILGDSLARLVLDNAVLGEEMPKSAQGRLNTIADEMGLPSGEAVLMLATQAAQTP